jgi:TetR/AcrR family transcriptional regulator
MLSMSFDKTFEHSEELLEAALQEFAAQGYQQASINTILQKAGMSKGQFYYHFGNKEKLYLALIDVLIARKVAFMQTVMQPTDFQQDIFGILKTQTLYGLAFGRAHPLIDQFANKFLKEKGTPIYEKAMEIHRFE